MSIAKIKALHVRAVSAQIKADMLLGSLAAEIQKHAEEETEIVCSYLQGDGVGVTHINGMCHITVNEAIEAIEKKWPLDVDFINDNSSL